MPLDYMNADGTADNVFALRGAHDLNFGAGPGQEGEFARKLLAHCPLTTVGAGDAQQMTMPWATAAAFMLPHVSLDNNAASVKVFTVYVNPAAWSRWWNAITSLAFTPGDAEAAALGVVQARITQRLAVASDATRLQLTLTAADLSAVQADLEYAEGAVQANFADGEPEAEKLRRELQDRRFLQLIPFCAFRGADGKLATLGWLHSHLGSHVTRASREASAFHRNVSILARAVAKQ